MTARPGCRAPTQSATTPRRCAPSCAASRASSSSGEIANLRPPTRARAYFELRDAGGAIPCAMWRNDWDRLGVLADSLTDGTQVIVSGGCDYYPGSASASPSFSFSVATVRIAGEGDLLAQIERRRRALAADGLLERQRGSAAAAAAALDRRRLRRERQGARGRPRRSRAPRLVGPRRVGVHPGPGPPCGPPDRRGAARAGSHGRRRGHRHRSRRRLPDRSAGVLRRAAVPHRRAPAGAGDRLDRPPHRSHAARRGGGRQLLDPDPRRRGGGPAALPRRATRRSATPRRASRATPASACRGGRGCWRRSRAPRPRTWSASAGAFTRSCASCVPPRGARSPTSVRARFGAPASSTAPASARAATARTRRPAELDRLRLALEAHDPARTLARGYAMVDDGSERPITTAAAARAAGTVAIRFTDDSVAARIDPT